MKQEIYKEVQKAYELTSPKLIRAAVMCRLSHGKAVQPVLHHYESLIVSLDAIYKSMDQEMI